MTPELVVLDPDIFRFYDELSDNHFFLEWISDRIEDFKFAVDGPTSGGDGELIRRYEDFLIERESEREEGSNLAYDLLIKLLPLLRAAQRLNASQTVNPNLEAVLKQCNNLIDGPRGSDGINDIESTMIRMAAGSPKLGVCLFLVSHDSKCLRRLHNSKCRNDLIRAETKLRVLGASDRSYLLPIEEEENARAHWFEDKVALAMSRMFGGGLPVLSTPEDIERKCGDIDVWIELCLRERLDVHVIIAECKLNLYSAESFVAVKKVKQLQARIPEVKRKLSETLQVNDNNIAITSYVVSNAPDMTCEAWELASKCQINFLRAVISGEFKRANKWSIASFEEFEPLEAETGKWQGSFVRKVPL